MSRFEYCCRPRASLYGHCSPCNGHFQQDKASSHKGEVSNLFHEHDSEFSDLQWTPQSPGLDPVEHLWDVVEQEIGSMNAHLMNLQKSGFAVTSTWTRISKHCS